MGNSSKRIASTQWTESDYSSDRQAASHWPIAAMSEYHVRAPSEAGPEPSFRRELPSWNEQSLYVEQMIYLLRRLTFRLSRVLVITADASDASISRSPCPHAAAL